MTFRDMVCSKLQATVEEFDYRNLKEAVLAGPVDLRDPHYKTVSIEGYTYFYAPTLPNVILMNVPYKVARFFEDAM